MACILLAEQEPQKVFADTIAGYEAWCKEEGEEPQRPYSGNLPLRIPPDLHRAWAPAAVKAEKSVNAYMTCLITEATREDAT
jgi:predicted HicB family RNase H-like nuclease